MASLEDFSSPVKPTLEELNPGKNVIAPSVSKSSNLNLATYSAAMSSNPDEVVGLYRTINAEMDLTGKSTTSDELVRRARTKSIELNTQALVGVLASPDFTDEQKQQAALNALDVTSSQYDVRNLLSLEAISASVQNEEPRAEMNRVEVGAIINRVNAFKREEQAILNAELAKDNPDLTHSVANVVEYMLPYTESKMAGEVLSRMRQGDAVAYGEALTLLGSAKVDIRSMLEQTPVEDRLALTHDVIQIINDSSTIVLPDGNDYARKDYLQTVLDHGTYDNVDKWMDNIISVLDVTVLGGLAGRVIKSGVKGTALATKAEQVASNVQRRMVKSRVQPTTLSQNYKDTNLDKARSTLDIAVEDDTGEAAEALYGTTRTDAVGNDILPEIGLSDGSVSAKVSMPERNLELSESIDLNILDFASNDGAIYAFNSEKAQARAASVARFENVIGMNARKEMFQITETGQGVSIRAVYGPTEGGFSNAEDAINMAKWSLREEGIADDQIKLLSRDGSGYREVTPEEFDLMAGRDVIRGGPSGAMGYTLTRQPKDLLVSIDHNYSFRPSDVTAWAEADVKYNIFDRLSLLTGKGGVGSLQRHLVDAHSMLHPNITMGATVAVDKAAGLEKELLGLGKTFADNFAKADGEIQGVMTKLVKEANDLGKEHSYAEMVSAGLRDSEIQAMKDWRKYWDTMYQLENADMAKTLRGRGFYEYVDELSDTRLFAKPIARTQTGKVGKVYDPSTGEVVRLRDDQIKALYDKDGVLARLRQPMVIGDDAVEHILSVNAPGKNYLRAIADSTQVLNYRKGYYSVQYKDPYFIVEKVKNSRGETLYERAIATASNKKDAEAMAMSKASNEGKVFNDDYFVRGDVKKMDMSSDDYWDLQQVRGRSAQRVRGKRLEEADTNITDPSQSNILDPVDSMILSARSVSHRVAMRDMLETTKSRFIEQYKDFLPTGDFGQKVMPPNLADIMYRGGGPENAKKLGDAKTTFEYIKYLEDGYINHIDDTYKATLKGIADIAGNAGLAKTDKAARWLAEGRGPSAMGKNVAFNMYLALNPLRQLIVQSHQAVQLAANYPRWIVGGQAVPQLTVLMAKQMGVKVPDSLLKGAGLTAKQADEMYAQFSKTGQVAAIDKQNLVRGALLDLSDQMNLGKSIAGKTWKITTAPLTWSRKLGFDAGENVNTMTAWLANRDTALREGLDMGDSSVQATVAAKARNYTYNMNAAGDMPYNQNMLSAVFQFMQVPHKALLTMTTNRVLTPSQKARLGAFNAAMYTLPPAAMLSWFGEAGLDVLPEDQEARDVVIQGLEGYTLNKLLSLSTGQDSTVDWSGLSPMDMYGTMEFVHSLFTTDVGTIIASTPSGQLLFGNNPRLTNFAKSAARYFNLVDDYQDPTTFGQVALEFGKLSSGFSNAYKAAYVLEYNKKYGTLGGNTNSNIPNPNAVALVFGFQSLEDAQGRYVSDTLYKKSQDFEKDIKEYYKGVKAHILGKYPGITDSEFAVKVPSEAWRVWGNDDYRARKMLDMELKRDLVNKDARLYQRILRDHGMMSAEEFKGLIKATRFDNEEQRQRALDTVDFMNKYKEE